MQRDSSIAFEVQRQLAHLIAATPALQKVVEGQSPTLTQQHHLSLQLHSFQQRPSCSQLRKCWPAATPRLSRHSSSCLGLTVREKHYRPHEFASRGNFYFAKNINDKNITIPLYVYGYLKHCVILMSGVVPVAKGEVMARLVILMHIMEITSNNSSLNDFEHPAPSLGRGYIDRIFNDIQQGLRNWPDLPNNILPDVFLHVKDMCEMQAKRKDPTRGKGGGRGGRTGGKERSSSVRLAGDKPLVCSTYNDFFTGTGCAYELNNTRKCSYEHFCSKCYASSGAKVAHKARFCTISSSVAVPVVTTSG